MGFHAWANVSLHVVTTSSPGGTLQASCFQDDGQSMERSSLVLVVQLLQDLPERGQAFLQGH